MPPTTAPSALHYLPLLTTVLAAVFATRLFAKWRDRGGPHLLWWGIGITVYGVGTALESWITLFGNSIGLNKAWYVAGAILGAWPLAQGTVFLLCRRSVARTLTWLTMPVAAALAALVVASPVVVSEVEAHRPTGDVLGWTWLRALTPIVNGYAALFLVGGAVFSAVRDSRQGRAHRALGNALIALGALLPGIGGGMAKAGMVEALYVGELVGIVLIWWGSGLCARTPSRG